MKAKKRFLSLLLCGAMLFSLCPQTALAEAAQNGGAAGGLCEHHPQHTVKCGYTEGSESMPCGHEHTDGCYTLVTECVHEHGPECYLAEDVSGNTATPSEPEEQEPTECTHVCSEESGCITEVLDCKHEHDEACGYTPATEGTPCAYVCEICNPQDSGEVEEAVTEGVTATPSNALPVETLAADDETGTAPSWTYDSTVQTLTCTVGETTITLNDVTAVSSYLTIGNNSTNPSLSGVTTLDLSGAIVDTNGAPTEYYIIMIGESAFQNCANLTSVTLPENLQFIEDSAFYCSGLTSIILPDSVSEIGDSAFQNCASLTSVNLTADSQLSSIGADAFYGCFNLASITLPDSLQSIGLTAFYNTALTSITLPKNLTDIASRAFDYCLSLAEIKVAEGNTSFVAEENVLFKLSEQDDPSNPSDPRKIELILYPAKKTGTSYTVPDTVTTIAANAFPNASLTSVVLPASVTAIGEMAFSDTGLTTVTVWATTPPTLANAALPDDLNIYVPASAVETYKANAAWCSFAKQISAIPDAGTTYAVTVEPSDGGTASASPTAAIEGAEITLTATPDTGYHFKEWQVVSGNITINDNKFTMPAEAVTVKAVFEQHSSTGTWQSDVNGHWKVCDSCGAKIQEATHTAATDDGDCTTAILCTVCGYTMTAAQSGHDYQWTSNQDGTHSGQCTHSGCNQQITNQSCDYEDGKCTLCGYEEITVTADPQSVTVTEGETAAFTVTATGSNIASYQWQISTDGGSNWTDIAGATGASYTIENTTTAMSGNQYRCVVSNSGDSDTSSAATLTVDPEQYTLTVELNGGSGSATGGSYPAGELIQIDAGTRPNYRFDGWTSSNGGTFADADSASTTFTMPAADTTITAQWEKITSGGGGGGPVYDSYTISASAGEGGTISPSGKISVREGRDQTFTITPANGYVISDVRVDGVSVSKVTSYTFENVRKRHTIEAVFAKENPETGVDNPFTDVHTGDWFYDDVMFVYENGLMIGTSDTTFSPNEAISRAQVAVIFYRMAGSPEVTGESAFTDVVNGPGTAWYYNAVLWAQQNGIVSGYGDDTFRPNDNITREQLAVIFYNYARYKGYDVSATDDLSGFTDAGDVSGWAQEAVQWAVGSSLLNGKGNGILDPKGTATRAEVAAMLCSFIENNQLVPPADTPDEGSGVTGPGNTGSTGGGQGWTQQTTSPQTGDSSSLGLWISLCALSLAGLVGTSIWYAARRRRYETEASSHPLIP